MRSKARSSSPAPPCSGCATGSASSATPPRPARSPTQADPDAGRLSRAGLRRPRRAVLGCRVPRRAVRPDARHRPRRARARRARERLLPDARSAARRCTPTGRARRPRDRAARRWRHGRHRLDHAAPRRHSRRAGRPARWSRRRRRSAPPISPGCRPASIPSPAEFADTWRLEHRFKPAMGAATRERKLAGWARAVKGVLASDEGE